jgi:HPt (histidine-containing phosphotransfer) domain-containing protein
VLKGLAGSFGIGELARLAREIEQHCRNGDAEAAMAATLSDLDRVVGAALAALADYRPGAGR